MCTLAVTQRELSHWKLGAACTEIGSELCDGKEDEGKCLKWRLPIPEFRFADDSGPGCSFIAKWAPTPCDRTHCLVTLDFAGREVSDFAQLDEGVRISVNAYLKRIAEKD